MQFDNGEVLQGLDEQWTFVGARMIEWMCGFMVFFMISLFAATPARAMPFMMLGLVATTVSLASLRKVFPDEERGVRNAFMTACGFEPLEIPAPAILQPFWSASPLRELPKEWKMVKLGLDKVVPSFADALEEAEE